jgi:kynurenine formamidase
MDEPGSGAFSLNRPIVSIAGRHFDLSAAAGHSLAIPLDFEGEQPSFFGVPRASRSAVSAGDFIGDTRQGGSCNCERLELVPHCNGTHTECVGHVTEQRAAVHALVGGVTLPALLLSITAQPLSESGESGPARAEPDDYVISRAALRDAARGIEAKDAAGALVLRSLPNDESKRSRDWMAEGAPAWLTREAAEWLVENGIEHLLVDLPSVDRADDGGELVAHRVFWGLPAGSRNIAEARRPHASITEMIFVPDELADGLWLLKLEIPAFNTDAVPSRPMLYPETDIAL